MRNTRLYIIAALVVLVIVVILATILTNRIENNQNQEQARQNQQKIETTTPKTLSKVERLREASRITKQSNTSLLTDEQVKKFNDLCAKVRAGQNGILSNEDFNISCSTVTNQFFVQKKTDKADAQLENFLKENNALDILQTDSSLFIKTSQPLSKYMKEQEESILEVFEEETLPEKEKEEEQSENIENPKSDDFDQIKETFTEIIQSLYDIENLATLEGSTEFSQSYVSVPGMIYPPNLGSLSNKGYFKMPNASNNEYVFGGWNQCDSHKYGSKALVDAIYTVATRWHAKYPNSKFTIGDLNAGPPHSSHKNGVDVDLMVYGTPPATQITAPIDANIDLGKMLIDTGVIKLIIFGTSENDTRGVSIRNAWKAYANSKGLAFQTYPYRGHDDHFHVRINDEFRGLEDSPGPCR